MPTAGPLYWRVFAVNEPDAIKRPIEEFNIRNPEYQTRRAARREE
jgi:hypothetical protein